MDAQTIFRMMKPHLDQMDSSEKNTLSHLITTGPSPKVSSHHKKVWTVKKAKENLETVCRREMKSEKAKFRSTT